MGERNKVEEIQEIVANMSNSVLGAILDEVIRSMETDGDLKQIDMDDIYMKIYESDAGFEHWKSQQ